MGPSASAAVQEGNNPERVDEEQKIIEGAVDQPNAGVVRESALNLGQQNEIVQASDEAVKAHPVSNDSKHLSSDCFAQIEF